MPGKAQGTPGNFDFGNHEDGFLGGDNSHVEDTFTIHGGGHSEHPRDILGDLGKPVVLQYLHICVTFDELLRAHIL